MFNNKWKDFITDIGDTIGGVLVGLSFNPQSKIMLIVGIYMIMTSIYLEYFKKGKKSVV